jgi:hypothetical protein
MYSTGSNKFNANRDWQAVARLDILLQVIKSVTNVTSYGRIPFRLVKVLLSIICYILIYISPSKFAQALRLPTFITEVTVLYLGRDTD